MHHAHRASSTPAAQSAGQTDTLDVVNVEVLLLLLLLGRDHAALHAVRNLGLLRLLVLIIALLEPDAVIFVAVSLLLGVLRKVCMYVSIPESKPGLEYTSRSGKGAKHTTQERARRSRYPYEQAVGGGKSGPPI